MKRPRYVLRLLAVAALLATMLIGTAATTFASPSPGGGPGAVWDGTAPPGPLGAVESDATLDPSVDGAQEIYFASVANGVDFGLGAASTSITIQSSLALDSYVFFWVGGAWDLSLTSYLSGGASKTYSAAYLGIAPGEDVPVIVAMYNTLTADETIAGLGAGFAKQAVAGANLPYTSDVDTSVSGYNAVTGREVGYFNTLYFPIVQTNCGPGGCWDTNLIVANVGADDNAAVTIAFFPADDGSGSLQTGFQIQRLLNVGDSWSVNLSTLVPDGWVGSARVYSDDAVVAIANRFKAGTDMWVTNTASNAVSEHNWQWPNFDLLLQLSYVLYAPDVRTDWNGWNMGINVANTVTWDNNVHIQYVGANAPSGLSQRLAADGMTYFYNASDPSEDNCAQPATQVPTCDFIGGALILSEYPVTAVVDGVKYFGNDSNVGQAFSYSAAGNVSFLLAAPLVQKGEASTGMGATSGINFMNPSPQVTMVLVEWLNPSGYPAAATSAVSVAVPGFATGFVYTMNMHNLPNGFLGSAFIISLPGPVVATTANVDYQVSGDGTAVWNLYNPCGLFRQDGGMYSGEMFIFQCVFGNLPFGIDVYSVDMVVSVDDDRNPGTPAIDDAIAEGMTFTLNGMSDYGHPYSVTSDAVECSIDCATGVPAYPGDYTVTVNNVPAGYDASITSTMSPLGNVEDNEVITVVLTPKPATLNVTVQYNGTTVGTGESVHAVLGATAVTTGQGGSCTGGTAAPGNPVDTTALGVASFSDLLPGIYCVSVDVNGDGSAVVGVVSVPIGGISEITLNDVSMSQGVTFTVLDSSQPLHVAGKVDIYEWASGSAEGQGGSGGMCVGGSLLHSYTTDASGQLIVSLPPGIYCVAGNAQSGGTSWVVVKVTIPGSTNVILNDTAN